MANRSPQSLADRLLSESGDDIDAAIKALKQAKVNKSSKKSKTTSKAPLVVEVKDLTKKYKVGKHFIEALKGVSLEVHEGEFIALTGASGSGKSTLLQLIGGLDKPTSGQVIVNGQNISDLSDRNLSVFRNKTIGFVFQFFYLQPFLKLQTNLEVPAMFAGSDLSSRKTRVRELAEAVGLDDRLAHYPKELSGGQMQRAAIARALLNEPKILLADEPTGNLDSENGKAIIDLFEQISKQFGTTIVVVTHDAKIAARADREISLKDGLILT